MSEPYPSGELTSQPGLTSPFSSDSQTNDSATNAASGGLNSAKEDAGASAAAKKAVDASARPEHGRSGRIILAEDYAYDHVWMVGEIFVTLLAFMTGGILIERRRRTQWLRRGQRERRRRAQADDSMSVQGLSTHTRRPRRS